MNSFIQKQIMNSALGEAMERCVPFSWTTKKNKTDVQVGVYISYTQSTFQNYNMGSAKDCEFPLAI